VLLWGILEEIDDEARRLRNHCHEPAVGLSVAQDSVASKRAFRSSRRFLDSFLSRARDVRHRPERRKWMEGVMKNETRSAGARAVALVLAQRLEQLLGDLALLLPRESGRAAE
jgi:hypothetical protein